MMNFNKEEIEKYINGVDYHLTKIWELLPFMIEFKNTLIQLKEAHDSSLVHEVSQLQEEVRTIYSYIAENKNLPSSYDQEMNTLKHLLKTEWPEAIAQECIINNIESETQLTSVTMELVIMEDFTNKKFLDFGCGKGHSINIAYSKGASLALGYDQTNDFIYDQSHFSSNLNEIAEKGPFDIVFLDNVLDHCVSENPIDLLKKVKNLTSEHGNIYIKTYPWSGRHGGEVQDQLNKAFIHLLFDEIELTRLGVISKPKNIVLNPIDTYRDWFKKSQLNIQNEILFRSGIEPFFLSSPILKKRLEKVYSQHPDHYSKYIAIDYIVYHLNKNKSASIDLLF